MADVSGSGLGSEETDLGIAPLFAGPTAEWKRRVPCSEIVKNCKGEREQLAEYQARLSMGPRGAAQVAATANLQKNYNPSLPSPGGRRGRG